uniref:Uncharacterized protein n=1 Tax=Gossypium raimondii TaxID=29730 RepID=A0A0D2NG04_GOSRA|nr:hypothetical protein B456_002G178500 [Gossypium raimondii]
MCPQTAFRPSKALDGVNGVQVVPRSPFALEEINQQREFQSTHDKSFFTANQPLLMQVWQQRPSCLRPVRCCMNGDQNFQETVANVLTSLPFIVLGIQAPRGKLRMYLRWADYTMIATATVCLSRALRNENPKLLMAASALLLPVQPLMVSAVHTGMMEVAFAKRALKYPELRMAHNVHKMSSLLGGVLFIADDVFPRTPFIHAAWHLAAAVGVGTCNKLLE